MPDASHPVHAFFIIFSTFFYDFTRQSIISREDTNFYPTLTGNIICHFTFFRKLVFIQFQRFRRH